MAAMVFSALYNGNVHRQSLYVSPVLKLHYERWNAFFPNEELFLEECAKVVVDMLGFKGKLALGLIEVEP